MGKTGSMARFSIVLVLFCAAAGMLFFAMDSTTKETAQRLKEIDQQLKNPRLYGTVVVTTKFIPANTLIKAEDVQEIVADRMDFPLNALHTKADVIGTRPLFNIAKGETLFESDFVAVKDKPVDPYEHIKAPSSRNGETNKETGCLLPMPIASPDATNTEPK